MWPSPLLFKKLPLLNTESCHSELGYNYNIKVVSSFYFYFEIFRYILQVGFIFLFCKNRVKNRKTKGFKMPEFHIF